MNADAERTGSRIAVAAAAVLAALLAACGQHETPAAQPAVGVNIVTAAVLPMPLDLRYSARTRGEREVEVHARVSGILLARHYREGARVSAGALLFKIDPSAYAHEAARLRAMVAVEKARLDEASAQRERTEALADKGLISRRDRDVAVSSYATALASADAARAALREAELNLAYTDVRAPIGGFTGRESHSEGSLVEAGGATSLLTTIVQSERLYVDFAMPEDEARLVRAAMQAGALTVRLAPGNRSEISQAARLEFLDSRVDADSGTVAARAVMDNSQGALSAGQFVRARIEGLHSPAALYIPVRAVLNTPDGALVWTLDKDNKVQPAPLKLGESTGNLVQVDSGLVPGIRVVVDGILKVQPGVLVKPVTIDINDPPGGAASVAVAAPQPTP